VMGPGVAQECIESKDGPVIWEDHFYPEIIDPVSEKVLPDGAQGELVLTSLTKEALPVIRYRTRDITTLLPPTSRSMRRMAKIVGRSDDMLIIRGVNVFPTQIEELIMKQAALSPHYVLEVVREGHLDDLIVKVEFANSHSGNHPDRALAAAGLVREIKAYVGISVRVVVCETNAIARSIGKAQRVIDKRAPAV
jgi:phenylacetate-CoA ligase